MKNQVTTRLLALAAAAVLSVQMLPVVALGAGTASIAVSPSGTVSGTAGTDDTFFYDLSAQTSMPASDDAATKIQTFDILNDWIIIKKPTLTPAPGVSSVTVNTNDTAITLELPADGSTPANSKKILTVLGEKNAAGVLSRIVPEAGPLVASIQVTQSDGKTPLATGNKAEVGTSVLLTPSIVKNNGATPPVVVSIPNTDTTSCTYQWQVSYNGGAKAAAPNGASQLLRVDTSKLAAGAYTYTLTATDKAPGGKASQQSVTVNVTKCTANPSSVTVTPSAATVAVNAATVTTDFNAAAAFDKTTAKCGGTHSAPATHDTTVSWTVDPPVACASIDSTGKLTIDRSKTNNGTVPSVTVKATVTGATTSSAGTATVSLTYATGCDYTLNSLTMASPVTEINADSVMVQQYTVTPNATGTFCNASPAHDLFHGNAVSWAVAPQVAGTDIAGCNTISAAGVLTIDKALLKKQETKITVTATANGKTASTNVTVKRGLKCDYLITQLGGVTTGGVTGSDAPVNMGGGKVVWKVTAPAASLAMTSAISAKSGSCTDYAGQTGVCPNKAKHELVWALDKDYSAQGITIHPATGVITADRSKFNNLYELTIGITASANGLHQTGYIVVKNGAYTAPAQEGPTQEELFNEQWNDIQYRISDAATKDTVSVKLLPGNTDLPGYVLRELRGRNVTMEFYMGDGHTWTVNGKSLKELPTYQLGIGLGVKEVSNKDAALKAKEHDLAIVDLDHNGNLYGTYYLTKRLDSDYANKTVYLYRYEAANPRLTYKGAAKVDSYGDVTFPFTSASTYVYTDRPLYGESAGGGTTSSVAPPPASSSVAPPASSSSSASSVPSSVSSTPEPSSVVSSGVISSPTDTKPEEPAKKPGKTPLIIPILFIGVALTIVAVILLAKNGMHIGE
ncbi:MAG: hypothetical protein RR276_00015 [Angelakisella sp.]